MLSASDRLHSRRDSLAFVLSVVVGIGGLLLPSSASQAVATTLRNSVFSPLVWLQEEAALGRTSRARFAELRAQLDSISIDAQSVPLLTAQNNELRQLLALGSRLGTAHVTVPVLHQPQAGDGRVLLIAAGADEGIRTFTPVVAPQGLIGAVLSVGARSSTVMTWSYPEFRASAYTADRRVAGIVAPSTGTAAGEGELEFRAASYRDTLLPGTRILSSGLGGIYPQGIPVGTIAGVAREQEGWERVYVVRPAALPASVSHVILLTGLDSTLPASAFPSDSLLMAVRHDSTVQAARADSALRVRIADSIRILLRDSLAAPRSAAATVPVPPRSAVVGDST